MKFYRSIGFCVAVLTIVVVLSGCGGKKSSGLKLESVLPKDSSIVMLVDFSTEEKVENFTDLVDKFPTLGFGKFFVQQFESSLGGEDISWSKDIVPIFEDEWKVGFATTFPDDVNLFEELGSKDVPVYIAFQGDNTKVLKNLITKQNKSVYEEKDGLEYWTNENTKTYAVSDRDVFFVTNTAEFRDEALKRLKSGGGFVSSCKGFVCVFVDENFMKLYSNLLTRLTQVYSFANRYGSGLFGTMGDIYFDVGADEDGFKFFQTFGVDKNNPGFDLLVPHPDYKVALVDKVNSKDIFFYIEDASMMDVFKLFVPNHLLKPGEEPEGQSPLNSVDPDSLQTSVLTPTDLEEPQASSAAAEDSFEAYIRQIISGINPFLARIEVLLDSPYAIAMATNNTLIPSVAFYFQIQDEDLSKVAQLVDDLDAFVDETLKELNATFEVDSKIKILRDVEVMNGSPFSRIYIDWSGVSEAEKVKFLSGMGIENAGLENELYYGLTSDNVFVFAWYPDFLKLYGKDVLAQDADYKKAVEKLEGIYGGSVVYLKTEGLFQFLDKILKLSTESGDISVLEMSQYDLYFKKFFGAFDYFITSGLYRDGKVESAGFLNVK